jgi:hypothetical protein
MSTPTHHYNLSHILYANPFSTLVNSILLYTPSYVNDRDTSTSTKERKGAWKLEEWRSSIYWVVSRSFSKIWFPSLCDLVVLSLSHGRDSTELLLSHHECHFFVDLSHGILPSGLFLVILLERWFGPLRENRFLPGVMCFCILCSSCSFSFFRKSPSNPWISGHPRGLGLIK